MSMYRNSRAATRAAQRGRKRTAPRMYNAIWEGIRAAPDTWHTINVPAHLQDRVIKALRKERWLAQTDQNHLLVIKKVNNQLIHACWRTHSGLLLADIPISGSIFDAPEQKA